jgi:chromosome segregation ATPase
MNPEKREEYFRLKSDIKAAESKIADKNQQAENLKHRIAETKATIDTITATLGREDQLIASNSKLKRPTLTGDQYKAQRQHAAALEAELPTLQQSLDDENRELSIFQSDLSGLRSALQRCNELLMVDLVDASTAELVSQANESIKRLVMSIIAVEGNYEGFNYEQKEQFKTKTYRVICEQLLPVVFAESNGLPGLQASQEYVAGLIEGAAA